MIYLSYNDPPSGIYQSQVIDVCKYLSELSKNKVLLVSLISLRSFKFNRKKIKQSWPNSIVIPMVPRHRNWKLNYYLLRLALMFVNKKHSIICRGVFASALGLRLKKAGLFSKVIFDARAAYAAEFAEYLDKEAQIHDDIRSLEQEVLNRTDMRLAVSRKLIEYWIKNYKYHQINHIVIPCTLTTVQNQTSAPLSHNIRESLFFSPDDIIMTYSGSSAEWQSAPELDNFLLQQLRSDPRIKVLFLSAFDLNKFESYRSFPSRIIQKWVAVKDVYAYLSVADYGLLLRKNSVTNQVASPVKFAEYLNAGLKIIISKSVGDFSDMVAEHDLGFVFTGESVSLSKPDKTEKKRMQNFARENFSKRKFETEYLQLLNQ